MIQWIVRRLVERRVLCFAQAEESYRERIIVLSTLHFHWKWKGKGYPRTIRQDLRAIRDLFKKEVVVRQDLPVRSFMMAVSDPASIPWDETHAPHVVRSHGALDPSWLVERCLPLKPIFFVVFFASYLKKSGDLKSATRLYERLIESGYSPSEGHFGLADVSHLLAMWRAQLASYTERQIYPAPPPGGEEAQADLIARRDEFNLMAAMDHYRAALRHLPESAYFRLQLGRALIDWGDRDAALEVFDGAWSQRPDNPIAGVWRAYASALVGRRGWRKQFKAAHGQSDAIGHNFGLARRVTIRTLREVAERLGLGHTELTPACTLSGTYVEVSANQEKARGYVISYKAPATVRLPHVRDLGFGFKLVQDRYLISDSKSLGPFEMGMFSPSLLITDRKMAVLGFRQHQQTVRARKAIILPGAAFNYYHWFFDCLGSLLLLEREVDLTACKLFLRMELAPFQRDAFDRLFGQAGPKLERLFEWWNGIVFDEVIHAPYPARFNTPHPEVIRRLRERLSSHAAAPKAGKRIYLNRKKVTGRKSVNEADIESQLERRGYISVDTAAMTLDQQIALFSDVEVLVAPAGAALTNLLFCPTQTRVVILASALHHFETFTPIANTIGQPVWVVMGDSVTYPNPFFTWSVFDHTIHSEDLVLAIHRAEESLSTKEK